MVEWHEEVEHTRWVLFNDLSTAGEIELNQGRYVARLHYYDSRSTFPPVSKFTTLQEAKYWVEKHI